MSSLSINKFASIRTAIALDLAATTQSEIDDAMSNPIVDRIPQVRAQNKVRGVLAVLDRLAKETPNRRFTT